MTPDAIATQDQADKLRSIYAAESIQAEKDARLNLEDFKSQTLQDIQEAQRQLDLRLSDFDKRTLDAANEAQQSLDKHLHDIENRALAHLEERKRDIDRTRSEVSRAITNIERGIPENIRNIPERLLPREVGNAIRELQRMRESLTSLEDEINNVTADTSARVAMERTETTEAAKQVADRVAQRAVEERTRIVQEARQANTNAAIAAQERLRLLEGIAEQAADLRPRIFGFDGTGPDDDDEYAKEFANSFVRRVCLRQGDTAVYYRGSSIMDEPSHSAWTVKVAGDVCAQHAKTPLAKIILTGYSRGAAAVVDVAQQLKALGIVVDAMFLFDAASRSWRIGGYTVPNNVVHCYHAFRDPSASSRPSFGYAGNSFEPGVVFIYVPFRTTHGGMGGVPWGKGGLIDSPERPPAAAVPEKIREFVRLHPGSGYCIYEFPENTMTTITCEEESVGMSQVEAWMRAHMIVHGITF